MITVAALPSTTGQSGVVGTRLPQPLTVQVAADSTPMPGVTVTWQASAGTVGRTTSVTDSGGLTTSAWTLGGDTGIQTATATVAEAHGSPVVFSARALAVPPEPPPIEPPPIDPPPIPPGAEEIFVRPLAVQLRPGGSYQMTAIALDLNGSRLPDTAVTWESRHPDIAAISTSGLLTAVAPGSTTITATIDGVRGTAAITVLGPIVSVKLVPTPATIAVGEEVSWGVEARDAVGVLMVQWDAAWRSQNPGIAFVGLQGGIIGVRPGTAEIAATVEGVTGRARLTVVAPLNLSGDWSMDENFSLDGYFPCAASGPVVLAQEHSSARIDGTYQRAGICPQDQHHALDITGAVPLHGTIIGSSVSLESSTIYHCDYQGLVSGDSPNRVEGHVRCVGLPGTAQEGWEYYGRFTMAK